MTQYFFLNFNQHFRNFEPWFLRVLFDKIAIIYFIWKIYLYVSIGNGQPREPALCQLYRHTFVPYQRRDYRPLLPINWLSAAILGRLGRLVLGWFRAHVFQCCRSVHTGDKFTWVLRRTRLQTITVAVYGRLNVNVALNRPAFASSVWYGPAYCDRGGRSMW